MSNHIYSFFEDARRFLTPEQGGSSVQRLDEMSEGEFLAEVEKIAKALARAGAEAVAALAAAKRVRKALKEGQLPSKSDVLVLTAALDDLTSRASTASRHLLVMVENHRKRRSSQVLNPDWDPREE